MAATPAQLLALIDSYAAARARREALSHAAEWAFLEAHRDMAAARVAVVDALGIPDAPPLRDDLGALAARSEAREAAHAARIAEAVGR